MPCSGAFPQAPPSLNTFTAARSLIIGGTYAGAPERGHEILRPLREFDEPLLDMSATIPYRALQQLFDPFFRKGEFLHYWKAIYLDRLTDDAIEAIVGGCAVEALSKISACHLGARRGDGPRRQG